MKKKLHYLVSFVLFLTFNSFAINGTIKFSDDFYAAQKYFYREAKKKYSKLGPEKVYPEVPIKGSATSDELSRIEPLTDYFEARRKFLYEISLYPEQIYPEIFGFLNGHPALSINAGNKSRMAAIEMYFSPFYFAFSPDKHYSFNADIKQNPCPLVIYVKDIKKNTFSFNIYNTSKKGLDFSITKNPNSDYVNVLNKKPLTLKGGGSGTVKFTVDALKLKTDSMFRVINFVLFDPTQPKLKLIIPVILLPSRDFMNFPAFFYDITFSYGTFLKHISLQKEKASWPEPCPSSDCSGKRSYTPRSAERLTSSYNFGEFCTVQYYFTTASNPLYNIKNNQLQFTYNETGNLAGEERNCFDAKAGIEVHCPTDAPNNGKEIYGNRKIAFKLHLPTGKTHEVKIKLSYSDLQNQAFQNSELSWLQEKRLLLVILDNNDKEVFKEFIHKNPIQLSTKPLPAGTYTINIFPTTEDGKHVPSFNIQHLNHGDKSRFDFTLNGSFNVVSTPLQSK